MTREGKGGFFLSLHCIALRARSDALPDGKASPLVNLCIKICVLLMYDKGKKQASLQQSD